MRDYAYFIIEEVYTAGTTCPDFKSDRWGCITTEGATLAEMRIHRRCSFVELNSHNPEWKVVLGKLHRTEAQVLQAHVLAIGATWHGAPVINMMSNQMSMF